MEKKHWLAVAFFVIMITIVQIIVSSPAFGATVIFNDENGAREVTHIEMNEEKYVAFALDYKDHKVDLDNFSPKGRTGTWYHFVYDNYDNSVVEIWLTEEEGQEMLKYLERMFGWQTW